MPTDYTVFPARQTASAPLLAALPLSVGDVVTITLAAKDRAGQAGASEPLQVLVSPRSVDLATYRRIAELASAADLADGLAE